MLRRRKNADSTDIHNWWSTARASAPATVAGLWFGLVELAGERRNGWHMYVAGTSTFDADDETAEWAVPDYEWWPEPKDRYFPVPALADLDVEESLAHAAALVTSIAPWTEVPAQGVGVGFDGGDFEIVHLRGSHSA